MEGILKATTWNEFWVDLTNGIREFFNPDLSGYTNFSLGSNGIVNIHVIVFGIYIGIMLAAVYTIYTKNVLGKMVRNLLETGSIEPENAKTLDELGLKKNLFIRLALRGYSMNRIVNSIEKDEFIKDTNEARNTYEENRKASAKIGKRLPPFPEPKFDKKPEECRYYITEKNRITSEMRFNANGSGYGTFFFVLLIASICVIIVYSLLPHLLTLVDKSLNDFTVRGNTYVPGQ